MSLSLIWRQRHEKGSNWLIRILIPLSMQTDLRKSHGFLGVMLVSVTWWKGFTAPGSEGCTLSQVCLYSLPRRYTLLKLNTQIILPHWDFMQGRLRNRRSVVHLAEGQRLPCAGGGSGGQMSTFNTQCRRHGNSAFLISKLTVYLGLIQRTVISCELRKLAKYATTKFVFLKFTWL